MPNLAAYQLQVGFQSNIADDRSFLWSEGNAQAETAVQHMRQILNLWSELLRECSTPFSLNEVYSLHVYLSSHRAEF